MLSNARKHTQEGHVTLRFIGDADSMLEFSVVDSGQGIAPHVASKLFHEEVTTGAERGVGLGLVSCKKIAEAINGTVWLFSTKQRTVEEPNGGTEFRFCLPGAIFYTGDYERSAMLPPTQPTAPKFTHITSVLGECCVYVVEDSGLIRKSITTKLKVIAAAAQCKWTFIEHATVESILPTIREFTQSPNVIVTVDENLESQGGIMKGSELIRKLKAQDFCGIVISATGDGDTAHRHKDLGADLAW